MMCMREPVVAFLIRYPLKTCFQRRTMMTRFFVTALLVTSVAACAAPLAPTVDPAPAPTPRPLPTEPIPEGDPGPTEPIHEPPARPKKLACGIAKTRLELPRSWLHLNDRAQAVIRNVDDRDHCETPWGLVCGRLKWTVILTDSKGVTVTANAPEGHYRCPAVKRPSITEFRLPAAQVVIVPLDLSATWYLVKQDELRPSRDIVRPRKVRKRSVKLKPGKYTLRIRGGRIAHEMEVELVQ